MTGEGVDLDAVTGVYQSWETGSLTCPDPQGPCLKCRLRAETLARHVPQMVAEIAELRATLAAQQPEQEAIRWAVRWIDADGQVCEETDATGNAVETAEQRAHRIAAKRLRGTVRGEVIRWRVLTMPAEVVAAYPVNPDLHGEPL